MDNYRIEETGFGKPSEMCFIVIHPSGDIDDVAECCRDMFGTHLKRVWIVVDNRCAPLQVKDTLKVIRDVMPNLEYIVRFSHPFLIRLMFQLWQKMKRYCEKRSCQR